MMAQARPRHEVRRYDAFKLITLLVLAGFVAATQLMGSAETVTTTTTVPTIEISIPTPAPVMAAPTSIPIAMPSIVLDADDILFTGSQLALSGTGTPENVVLLRENGQERGQAVIDADGNWSYAVELSDAGQMSWTAVETDGAGNISAETSPLLLEVRPEPTAPTLTVSDVVDGSVTLSGSAEAGAIVGVLINDRIYDVATADGSGVWTYTLPLVPGEYVLGAQLIDNTIEDVLSSETFTLTVDE